jgi:hypothetical protein
MLWNLVGNTYACVEVDASPQGRGIRNRGSIKEKAVHNVKTNDSGVISAAVEIDPM